MIHNQYSVLFSSILVLIDISLGNNQCQVADICVAEVTEEICWGTQVLVQNAQIFGCCPGCQEPEPFQPPVLTLECRPPSNCLEDGRFAPVQCKGDMFVGRCFCSDESGNRIFGQMWRADASEMNCACSRRRAELEASEIRSVTLHCTRNGDYEPLQCDDGMCWCAEPRTGQPTAGPVPSDDMKYLPCFSLDVGDNYLRQCESIVHSLAVIEQEQNDHGTSFLGNPVTFCDYDGSYGSYQIINGIAYCTGRDGEIMGAWQTMASEMAGMNCNCARDSFLYYPENGMMVTEMCQGNGNYVPNQSAGGVFYCVDTDGYQATDFLTAWPTDMCRSFVPQVS